MEFTVALLLFGVTMSGLFPLVAMYSRVLEVLEQRPTKLSLHRTNDATYGNNCEYRILKSDEWYRVGTLPDTTPNTEPNFGEWVHKWYLVPSSDSVSSATDAWARKLGASASIKYRSPTDRSGSPEELKEPTTADITVLDAAAGGTNPNYAETPDSWSDESSADALNITRRRQPPSEVATATWTFTGIVAGWYRIEATGLVSPGPLPSGCNYKLSLDGGLAWGDAITPNLTFGTNPSLTWQPLTTKYFSADTVTVRLNAPAGSLAIADGMRLVRCSVQIKSPWTPPTATTATATVEIKPALRP